MMQSVEYYVRGLFRGVEETAALAEQREELCAHIRDHIEDAMAAGLDEEAAFERAVASLGNLDELIDTLTGRRKRVRVKRAAAIGYAAMLGWGTLYMVAVGLWFAGRGFGNSALFIAIPGWLGFFFPFFFAFVDWRRKPGETKVISLDMAGKLRRCLVIWIVISAACFGVNTAFAGGDTFLRVFWSWMPSAGLFSMLVFYTVYRWILNHDDSGNEGFGGKP